MRSHPFVLGVAAFCTALCGGPSALAGDGDEKPKTDLVDVLGPTPVGRVLDRLGIRPYGSIEIAVSTTPGLRADSRAGRVFDSDPEGFRMHQVYFALERTPADDRRFDLGGKVAMLWGTDASSVHAVGLLDEQEDVEQFDLLEAKLTARSCAVHGLMLTAGKFTTPLGYEVIEAFNNLLPSRSFLFNYAVPFTHVGAMATLELNERWKLSYGVVEGWDVWDDTNDALTQLGSVAWTSPSKRDTVTVNAILGAEQPDDDDDLRGVLDATWTHTFCGGKWTSAINADVGFEEGAGPSGGDAHWGGVAAYLTDKLSERVSVTGRAEWFQDADGSRLGQEATLGELTVGLDWRPFHCVPNLRVRPEVRWDHSFDGPFFDDGRSEDQVSVTLDLLFTF